VNPKKTLRISIALLFASLAISASAAPKDGAALKKIDEAINVHYLATEFDKAEAQLLGVIKACGKDCSPNVIAKAYMYIGLVRGSGKQNMAAAREAFEKAKAADAAITLDAALATPEVQAEFNKTKAGAGGAAAATPAPVAATPAPAAATPAPAAAAEGGFACTPVENYEIQVRQPIPVSCTPPAGVVKGDLYYKAPNGEEFKSVPMKVQGGTLRGQIPCDGVNAAGALNFYVIAQDANGDTIDTLGTEAAPQTYNIVAQSAQPAPAYPGAQPPAKCGAAGSIEKGECPPGMPGCAGGGGWGDACTPAEPCKKGLYCQSGTCENAPSCETNSDCDSGRCEDGFCQMGDAPGGAGGGKFRRVMVGLHFAPDIWMTPKATDVCGNSSVEQGTYTCYRSGTTSIDPNGLDNEPLAAKGYAGTINQGAAIATIRILLSLDYALTPNITLGGRAGMALRGGPPSIKYNQGTATKSTAFLPFHIEARAAYWFRPLSMPGLHPYIHIGGGMAQVDGKVPVSVFKCQDVAHRADDFSCQQANNDGSSGYDQNIYKYDAWRKMGQGFATVGGGAILPVTSSSGVQLNLNVMFMLPASGTVFQPSLGYVMGL
jgi:hypothetical protein